MTSSVPKRKPIAHGTPKGYKQHWRRHETACDPCKGAIAAYQRARAAAAAGAPIGDDGQPRYYLTEAEWQARRNGGAQ